MARLIDADAVIRQIDEMRPGRCYEDAWALTVMNSAPTVDAVPVVRCEKCDMWNEDDFSGRKSLGNYRCSCAEWSNLEDGRRVYTGPDEFCSRGERKGGDE